MALSDTIQFDDKTGQIKIDLRKHPKALQFVSSNKIRKSFTGGRGSAKSVSGAINFCMRCKPGGRYFVIGPSYTMLQGTIDTFIEVAKAFRLWDDNQYWTTKPPRCILNNGAEVHFRSGDDPRYLKGGDKAGAWIDEAQDCTEDVYWMTEPCLRQWGKLGWMAATFTPGSPDHWTSKTFITPSNPEDVFFIRASLSENPFAPPGQYEKLKQAWASAPLRIRRELEGECLYLEGAEWDPSYFNTVDFEQWPKDQRQGIRVIVLDSSKGKSDKQGDYSAFVSLWFIPGNPATIYLDAYMRNDMGDAEICQQGVALYKAFNPHYFIIENESHQTDHLVTNMHKIADDQGLPMAIATVDSKIYGLLGGGKIDKKSRIRSLTPYISERWFRFKANSDGAKLLRDQLMAFPVGDHDDGPDAAAYGIATLQCATTGRVSRPVTYSRDPMGQITTPMFKQAM